MTRFMLVATLAIFVTGATADPGQAGDQSEPIRPAGKPANEGTARDGKVDLVRMKPIIVQLPGPGGLSRNAAFTLTLELSSIRYRDEVIEKRPKLRARIFEAWASAPLARTSDKDFDPEDARRRAQRASDELFGEGVVVGILIEQIREVLVR